MIYKGKSILFPAVTQVSFFKLIDIVQQHAIKDDPFLSGYAKALLAECEKYPELLTGISPASFDKDNKIIQSLCSILFPDALQNNEIKGIIPPFEFRPFFMSERFKNILKNTDNDFSFELNDFNEDQLYIYGCASILSLYYKYPFLLNLPRLVTIPAGKDGRLHTYRMVMNGDLLEIIPTEKAVAITHDDYLELLDHFDNVEIWKQKFPPDSWIMKGIGVISLFDVTQDQSIANITAHLLSNSLDNLKEILPDIRNFLGIAQLKVGFLLYENGVFKADYKEELGNFILNGKHSMKCKSNLCPSSYDTLIKNGEPLIVTDADRFNEDSCSTVSKTLKLLELNSYILLPIKHHSTELGFLELASPNKYDLSGATLFKMNAIMPIISMAISRHRNEFQNKLEAVIQQECTTIHSSVKWRFEEEAFNFIKKKETEEHPLFDDIIFRQLYPLYGQLDIRSSSQKRNDAVLHDLTQQLNLVNDILKDAWQQTKIPIYEELLFRVHAYKYELQQELLSGSEQNIVHFLEKEIHPIFDECVKTKNALSTSITEYFELLQPGLHTIYNQRQQYDTNVNHINKELSAFLDLKQMEAQAIYPHYFERYKTDGIEYNIYIGESISKTKEFSQLYLQNLQLWQLMVTCELELEFIKIKNKLDANLEIASLILVYNTPISIHFRMDEKRFDVEGAYNARYEIIKKRIDKANIKGTTERLTCPGKIAIVYTNEQDAITYERYLLFLENKGYIKPDSKENLAVEDLQGISGLMAIRVAINYSYK